MARIKIRVPLLIEVDPAEWASSNGAIADAQGKAPVSIVREDVKEYILNFVQQSNMLGETNATASLA